ncbi:MAG: peptide deformylase [Clostridia bacterium]|nr:peptide deformylase [Clostridia bacterium]
MAIRNLRYDGDEILRKKSKEIEKIDEKIIELAQDMMDTMHKWNGLGLSAVQVGVLKRLVVMDMYEEGEQYILINPVIIKEKGTQECDEGCLSFPNQYGKVDRPLEVTVEALDINGKKVRIKAKGLLAECISHELDHLEGILFTDKVKPGTLEVVNPENQKAGEKNQ